jgi:hypothetical protein
MGRALNPSKGGRNKVEGTQQDIEGKKQAAQFGKAPRWNMCSIFWISADGVCYFE